MNMHIPYVGGLMEHENKVMHDNRKKQFTVESCKHFNHHLQILYDGAIRFDTTCWGYGGTLHSYTNGSRQ